LGYFSPVFGAMTSENLATLLPCWPWECMAVCFQSPVVRYEKWVTGYVNDDCCLIHNPNAVHSD